MNAHDDPDYFDADFGSPGSFNLASPLTAAEVDELPHDEPEAPEAPDLLQAAKHASYWIDAVRSGALEPDGDDRDLRELEAAIAAAEKPPVVTGEVIDPPAKPLTIAQALASIQGIEPHADLTRIQSAILLRDWIKQQARAIDELCDERVLEWIQENKREVTIGTVRYFAGTASSVKCLDVPGTVEEILKATGGDFGATCSCLSAGAIKHGAAGKVLAPEVYGRLFSTEKKIVLKEGKPQQQLLKLDTEFVK